MAWAILELKGGAFEGLNSQEVGVLGPLILVRQLGRAFSGHNGGETRVVSPPKGEKNPLWWG